MHSPKFKTRNERGAVMATYCISDIHQLRFCTKAEKIAKFGMILYTKIKSALTAGAYSADSLPLCAWMILKNFMSNQIRRIKYRKKEILL